MVADGQMTGGTRTMRILLVEDNYLIAATLKRMLMNLGCEVIGPVPSLEEGERLAAQESITGAILDINIIGGNSIPIAMALQHRGCPFFFITGYYSPEGLPESLVDVPRLNKPIDEAQLKSAMVAEFGLN